MLNRSLEKNALPKDEIDIFSEEMDAVCLSSKKKVKIFNNGIMKYLMIAALGGFFVGLAVMLLYTVGGIVDHSGSGVTKIIMGISFGCALSFVMMAGVDLFTSNSLVMLIGALYKKVTWLDFFKILLVSWIGNLFGSIIGGVIYAYSHTGTSYVQEFMINMAQSKIDTPMFDLILKGMLCNVLVCLAAWFSYKLKSESGKLIMIFWCLFTFITAGFEHSIANMTLFSIAYFLPNTTVTLGGAFYNIFFVSLGNFIGGTLLVGFPLYYIAKNK